MADKLHGFTRDDLAALADGLEAGYEKTVNVVEAKLESSTAAAARFIRAALAGAAWQPMATAPKDGTEVLAWFPKLKLDEDDNPTGEVVGGAMAPVQWQGEGWMEPGWLEASGSYFFDDFCFADEPVLWHPMPPEPAVPDGVSRIDAETISHQSPMPPKDRP